jgi:L-threonylcarbamoyladenylate synthase
MTLSAGEAQQMQQCLAGGGVVVFPADTVYGVGCDPENPTAVRRLYELKGRPPTRPAAVMFFALGHALERLPELGKRERRALERLLPGPLTVVLPNRRRRFPLACGLGLGEVEPGAGEVVSGAVAVESDARDVESGAGEADLDSLGLRVPQLGENLAVLGTVGMPVLQSSANVSGEPDVRRLADVAPRLREGADLLLDGGELPGVASTVLDLRSYERDGAWRVLRAGPVDAAALDRALSEC